MSTEFSLLRGALPAEHGQRISDAMHQALLNGMEPDEACCVAAAVIADYARTYYGNEYLNGLAKIVVAQGQKPMPRTVEGGAP